MTSKSLGRPRRGVAWGRRVCRCFLTVLADLCSSSPLFRGPEYGGQASRRAEQRGGGPSDPSPAEARGGGLCLNPEPAELGGRVRGGPLFLPLNWYPLPPPPPWSQQCQLPPAGTISSYSVRLARGERIGPEKWLASWAQSVKGQHFLCCFFLDTETLVGETGRE